MATTSKARRLQTGSWNAGIAIISMQACRMSSVYLSSMPNGRHASFSIFGIIEACMALQLHLNYCSVTVQISLPQNVMWSFFHDLQCKALALAQRSLG